MNGVKELSKIDFELNISKQDILMALICDIGCSVSSMPKNYPYDMVFSDKWELFDPEKVKNIEDLPDYWHKIYSIHNQPDMGDCRTLRYRYIHIPVKIKGSYPDLPCSGIFVIDRDVNINELKSKDLININNELVN